MNRSSGDTNTALLDYGSDRPFAAKVPRSSLPEEECPPGSERTTRRNVTASCLSRHLAATLT